MLLKIHFIITGSHTLAAMFAGLWKLESLMMRIIKSNVISDHLNQSHFVDEFFQL